MSNKDEAELILAEIEKGNFSFTDHGNQRSLQRVLPVSEIIFIAKHLVSWEWQEDRKTHLFIGFRTNRKGGGFAAVYRGGVVIVTVFKRTLK